MTDSADTGDETICQGKAAEVFGIFLKLGLTSFGGPIAHLGYFRTEFVERRRWLDDRGYSDLVALCQFLPGPSSSQVGMALGLGRAGWPGLLAAWAGFTLPSALALILFAYGIAHYQELALSGWVQGLKIVAVAIVAQAVWGMAKSLCPDRPRAVLAIVAALITLALPSTLGQVTAIALAGLYGWRRLNVNHGAGRDARSGGVADGRCGCHHVSLIDYSLEWVMSTRLTAFIPSEGTEQQKQVLKDILEGPRGNLNGPFLAWIHSPELAQHAQQLGAFCRYSTGLPLRLSELAILVTAARWKSQAEWYIHHPIALKAGISAEVAETIRTGGRPNFRKSDEELIYMFATELYDTKRVSDATFKEAKRVFGHDVVVNLVGLLGYYALVAMTLNVFEMKADGQMTLPFKE